MVIKKIEGRAEWVLNIIGFIFSCVALYVLIGICVRLDKVSNSSFLNDDLFWAFALLAVGITAGTILYWLVKRRKNITETKDYIIIS